jgi:transposase-like protein
LPRVINTDLAPTYPTAIAGLQRSGNLPRRCRHRPVQYLNNIVEQDHRFVKKRIIVAKQVSGRSDPRHRTNNVIYINRLFGLVR